MKFKKLYDIIIIGGGPAGSTTATLLAQWGHNVLLLEKEVFPRHHVGESLLPGTLKIFERLQVLAKIKNAGFTHKYGATYIWGNSREPWSIYFSEVDTELAHSFQVDRAKLDKILLDHSKECGVHVVEGAQVIDIIREGKRIVGIKFQNEKKKVFEINCKYCVDASGQNSFLGRKLKLRKFNKSLKHIALYGYFKDSKSIVDLFPKLEKKDAGNIFVVATEKGWIWYIPISKNKHSVGFVTDVKSLNGISNKDRKKHYLNNIFGTPELRKLLAGGELVDDLVYTQSDWSYTCSKFEGPGYFLVGDSACFIDPILSTGVDMAMQGAEKLAVAINTSLNNPRLALKAADWYEEEYTTMASNYLKMAEHWYFGHKSQKEWFWKAKKLVDPSSNLSIRQAFILLSGGFLNQEKGKDLPDLIPFGGFGIFQLKSIYSNLSHEELEVSSLNGSDNNIAPDVIPLREISISELKSRIPILGQDVRYRSYLKEENNQLIPVIQLVKDFEGVPRAKVALSIDSLPLVERVKGRLSTEEIVNELTPLYSKYQVKMSESVYSTISQLYKYSFIELN